MLAIRRHMDSRNSKNPVWVLIALTMLMSMNLPTPGFAATLDDTAWTTDVAAALESARAEGKDLLLLYTGSDWCPPCIKLEEAVLSKAEFTTAAAEKFVLVKLDFPQKTELPPELEEQNQKWSDRYGVDAFPTIVLIGQDEKPYAITGFREEGPAAYLTHLNELAEARVMRDEAFAKAKDAEGLERALLLDEGLSAMDVNIVQVYYADTLNEIDVLDPVDAGGLRTKYFEQRDREMRQSVMSNIAMVARLRKPDEAIAYIDTAIVEARLTLDLWLIAHQTKLRLLRKLDRVDDANALVDEMAMAVAEVPEIRQRLINNKAYYLASLGRMDDALEVLEKEIRTQPSNLLMTIAVGDLHDSVGQHEKAIAAYDRAIVAAAAQPESLLEVIQAKADVLVEMNKVDEALTTLDRIAEDAAIPARLRSQALLHKSLLLRESGRRRAAILAENRAVELVETVEEKAEIQKLIDQFRRKFDGESAGDTGQDN